MNGDINSSPLHVSFPSLAWVFNCLTLGQNKKTSRGDNVNVKVLPPLDYIFLSQILAVGQLDDVLKD